MTAKITDAINQLNQSIVSLNSAIPSMLDAAADKVLQVEALRENFFATHPGILTGLWNLDMSISQEHARLTGWKYNYDDNPGDDNGNLLVSSLALTDDEYATTIELPYSDEKPLTCDSPRIQLTVAVGDVRVDFYNIEPSEVFRIIKEYDITVEVTDIDKSISGFKERMTDLIDTKQAIIDAGLIAPETEQPPSHEETCSLPIEETGNVQFNAEAVSKLHKHVGVTYEYLTNVITQLHDNPEDVKLVEGMVHALFVVQSELDNIAVEIGDLDTKDEPVDIGLAGCAYWNMIQGAMYNLDDTIEYIVKQDMPLFAEVHFRLSKLSTILKNCNNEFEETWMGDNK